MSYAVGAFVAFLIIRIYDSIKQRFEEVDFEQLQKSAKLWDVLKHVVQKTSIDRALLLVAQNGKSVKYGSVVLEMNNDKVIEVKNLFKRWPLETEYSNLVDKVVQDRKLILHPESLKPGSYLERRYRIDGIKIAYIFFVAEVNNSGFIHKLIHATSKRYKHRKIYYLSFTSTNDQALTEELYTELEAGAVEITNIFKEITTAKNKF